MGTSDTYVCISKLLNKEDVFLEPNIMRIIKWLNESCEKLMKLFVGKPFDNAFYD